MEMKHQKHADFYGDNMMNPFFKSNIFFVNL